MTRLTRRSALSLAAAGLWPRAAAAASPGGAIESIEHMGVLIRECSLSGETRKDNVVPAHPNGIQVSPNRWLLIYATRTFRGVDDDLSIVYQLREGTIDGRVIKENFFSRAQSNWDPLGDGHANYVRQLGHPVLFGVPRGARIGGKPAPSANVFVAKWRRTARLLDPEKNQLLREIPDRTPSLRTQAVEWVQFRLNAAENDIEIIRPIALLRQKGYDDGDVFCAAPVKNINESFVQAVPYNRDGTEWADCCHFDGGQLACLKYVFNSGLGHYEWSTMGPLITAPNGRLSEASLARLGGRWIVAGRPSTAGVVWLATEDPFAKMPPIVHCDVPATTTPRTAYVWADGVLRLFTGDPSVSPYNAVRNPLYCWDIEASNRFTAGNRRVIFDSVKAGLPIRPPARPMIDMCKLLPHVGGRVQWIVHRVQVGGTSTPADREPCAIYYAKVTYAQAYPGRWEF